MSILVELLNSDNDVSGLYLGGAWFESQVVLQPSWPIFLWISISAAATTTGQISR
jgi:hypothetical protein